MSWATEQSWLFSHQGASFATLDVALASYSKVSLGPPDKRRETGAQPHPPAHTWPIPALCWKMGATARARDTGQEPLALLSDILKPSTNMVIRCSFYSSKKPVLAEINTCQQPTYAESHTEPLFSVPSGDIAPGKVTAA